MNELTAGDVWRIQEELEASAASILGRGLFAFSRLDVNLGLLVASLERKRGREERARQVDQLNLHKRLEFLETHIREAPDLDASARQAIGSWIQESHAVRVQRNQLVHGRWGVDPYMRKILNIVGLPSSETQHTVEYSLEELEAFVQAAHQLHLALASLRQCWSL